MTSGAAAVRRCAPSPPRARRARELRARRRRREHGCRVASERLGRCLGDGVERLLLGERLAQHGRDPVEAALDPGLAHLSYASAFRAIEARLAKASINRRSDLEAAGLAREDAERTAISPKEKIGASITSANAVYVRLGCGCSVAAKSRRSTGLPVAIESPTVPTAGAVRPISLGEPDHGAADELGAAGEERPAVGRVGVDQRAQLLYEPLDHGVEAEVAGQRLAGLEQRLLLGEAAVALTEQSGRVERHGRLAPDGLGESHLRRAPVARCRAVDDEHAEQPVLRQDRRGEDGADAPPRQLADVAERGVAQLGRVEDVGDATVRPVARRDWRRGAEPRHRAGDLGIPLRDDGVVSPARRAGRSTGSRRGCDRSPRAPPAGLRRRRGASAELERHLRDQPLALERLAECGRRARALERQAGLARERLHPRELSGLEDARAANRAEDDADHPLLRPTG